MSDVELTEFLRTHAAHDDLIRRGFVREISPPGTAPQYQVDHPPAIIEAIRTQELTGAVAQVAAVLVLRCRPPKGFWYATTPDELIERIRAGQPL